MTTVTELPLASSEDSLELSETTEASVSYIAATEGNLYEEGSVISLNELTMPLTDQEALTSALDWFFEADDALRQSAGTFLFERAVVAYQRSESIDDIIATVQAARRDLEALVSSNE